jgi:hypothetical protein
MQYHAHKATGGISRPIAETRSFACMHVLRDIREAWMHSRMYRGYAVLLLLAWIKQLFWPVWLIDSREFAQAALNLWNGHWSACGEMIPCGQHWLEATRRTPGYPFLMALTAHPAVLGFLQLLPALAVPVLAHKLSGGNLRLILVLFLLYPLQFFYTAWPMPEIWVQWLLIWAVYSWKERHWQHLPWLFSALVLLKPVFILLLPIAFYFFVKTKGIQGWMQLLPLAIVLVVCGFNQIKTGWFHYSSMGVENAYEYNHRAVLNKVNSPEEIAELSQRRDSLLLRMNYQQRAEFMQKQTREKLLAHPLLYGWLHLKGSVAVFIDPGRYDLLAFLRLEAGSGFMGIKKKGTAYWQQPWPVLVYLTFFILLRMMAIALALRGIIKSRKQADTWVMLLLIALFCAVAGPVGSARYLFPVAPMLFVLAVRGFSSLRSGY